MQVKVLDENRIKILMEDQDVEYYDLPFERINEEEPLVQEFLSDLLKRTKTEIGLDLHNSSLLVEVIPGSSRSYYILITRMAGQEDAKTSLYSEESAKAEMYLYMINDGEDVLRFFEQLRAYPPETAELFYYRKCYYAALYYRSRQISHPSFYSLLMQLEEFGGRCDYHAANIGLLRERAELVSNSFLLK